MPPILRGKSATAVRFAAAAENENGERLAIRFRRFSRFSSQPLAKWAKIRPIKSPLLGIAVHAVLPTFVRLKNSHSQLILQTPFAIRIEFCRPGFIDEVIRFTLCA
jgi:hypothetical protein